MSQAAIEARNLSAGYRDRLVLHDVSLEARSGEILAVIGPNGAGKSTLVRALSGTLGPSAGEVLLDGENIASLSRREIARRLAVVPQESDVAFGFNVRQVVMMGRTPHQSGLLLERPEDEVAVDRALGRCEISDLADRHVAELSGGERRRVTIARALAQSTGVLLLDEPAAHLDIRHAATVCALARREADERGAAIIAVFHDLAAAARWADRIVLLHQGRTRVAGSPAEVLTAELLSETYGIPIRVGVDGHGCRYFVPDLSK